MLDSWVAEGDIAVRQNDGLDRQSRTRLSAGRCRALELDVMPQRGALTGIGDAEEAVDSGCQPGIRFISLLGRPMLITNVWNGSPAEIVSLGESVSLPEKAYRRASQIDLVLG